MMQVSSGSPVRFGEVLKIYNGKSNPGSNHLTQSLVETTHQFFDAWVSQKLKQQKLSGIKSLGKNENSEKYPHNYAQLLLQQGSNQQPESAYLITNWPRCNSVDDYENYCDKNLATLLDEYGYTHLISFKQQKKGTEAEIELVLNESLNNKQLYSDYFDEAVKLSTNKGDIFTQKQPSQGSTYAKVSL